jgi:hypothetical protein
VVAFTPLPVTVHDTDFQLRPPLPVVPEGSITRSSQLRIEPEVDSETVGTTGDEGADNATLEAFAYEQATSDGHEPVLTLFARRATVDPISKFLVAVTFTEIWADIWELLVQRHLVFAAPGKSKHNEHLKEPV